MEAGRLLPRSVADRQGVLVIARDPAAPLRLHVAVVDPTNVFALDDVKMYTGAQDLAVSVAVESELRAALATVWSLAEEGATAALLDGLGTTNESELTFDDDSSAVDDAPVVRLVDMILADAVRQRASDVHVEVQRTDVRVRFRVDGLLRDVMTAPRTAAGSIVSRLKILSGLDIAERRRPQDGRARITVDGKAIDCRVSTLPSLHGEKVVLRLLARSQDLPPLAVGRAGADAARPAAAHPAAAAGSGADHRPDRLGKDVHAVRRDQRDQLAGQEHRHPRGPGRDRRPRHHAGRHPPKERADLRRRSALDPAAGPRRRAGRRDPRHRDGEAGARGVADRSPGALDPAHQRRRRRRDPAGRHGRGAVPGRRLAVAGGRPAPGPPALRPVRRARHPDSRRAGRCSA